MCRVPGQAIAPLISKTGSRVIVRVRPPANTGGAGKLCTGAAQALMYEWQQLLQSGACLRVCPHSGTVVLP